MEGVKYVTVVGVTWGYGDGCGEGYGHRNGSGNCHNSMISNWKGDGYFGDGNGQGSGNLDGTGDGWNYDIEDDEN